MCRVCTCVAARIFSSREAIAAEFFLTVILIQYCNEMDADGCSLNLLAYYSYRVCVNGTATTYVVVLFVMEIDEVIFAALKAWNEEWTKHAEEELEKKLREELARQNDEIAMLRGIVQILLRRLFLKVLPTKA